MNRFLFGIFPYLCLAVFVVGHVWRYRYDKFGFAPSVGPCWSLSGRADGTRTGRQSGAPLLQ